MKNRKKRAKTRLKRKSSINPYSQTKILELIKDCILGVPGALEEYKRRYGERF